jgi:hypothetical protein
MLLISGTHPQRRRRSRAGALCPFIEAQRRPLTDAGAEGTRPRIAPILCFQCVHAQQPPRLHRTATEHRFSS